MSELPKSLIDKIEALPEERVAEIEEFVDLVAAREQGRALTKAATAASVRVFEKVWSNPEDDVYDAL